MIDAEARDRTSTIINEMVNNFTIHTSPPQRAWGVSCDPFRVDTYIQTHARCQHGHNIVLTL